MSATNKIILLVGHRGVGKSTLLAQLKQLGHEAYDLDDQVATDHGASISELLADSETKFRELEHSTLDNLIAQIPGSVIGIDTEHDKVTDSDKATFICLGAGFEGPLPKHCHVIWVRRVTDASGRSFLSRPRLDQAKSPLGEYLDRFKVREARYRQWADEELTLPESPEGLDIAFVQSFFGNLQVPYDLTLLPENFRAWRSFVARRKAWNVRRYEVRDDLLTAEMIAQVKRDLPSRQVLYASRLAQSELPAGDWALELGEPPPTPSTQSKQIISLHTRQPGSLNETLAHINSFAARGILKLAVLIHTFQELKEGHQWWQQDPERRAFLPRSKNGRWRWYRSLYGPRMPLHFIREGDGSGLDQPFLWQAVRQVPFKKHFAAVLGSPVDHSYSPLEHLAYFKSKDMPFVSIEVLEDEWSTALPVLRALGLSHAAVTAPLKNKASELAGLQEPVNTLYFKGQQVRAMNTDVMALEKLKLELGLPTQQVWLWGGGGIKASVKKVWPHVEVIAARTGLSDSATHNRHPQLVIWAVGRREGIQMPPADIKPQLILDLNYGADSPGLEWAVAKNLPYQSGRKMFKLQAEAQRRFWQNCEAK
jgi:shikimate 5-dehydrogenase/energy-coupling factor transporter ATP-binding protein EcfA2